jgi:hypothetical protein
MYTTTQFETALLALEVQIEELKTPNGKVREAIGYKDRKRLTWNERGQCFFHKVHMPENDLKFNEITLDSNEEN